ncbi:hypothetical protein ACIBTV_29975 [Micromonospora sp. NPDC049366]|uniref:hypothetical protein n=1 Tax=Micromonospora sp. NPDC049366 TaxID=3364271 RepID=UPI0037AB0A10
MGLLHRAVAAATARAVGTALPRKTLVQRGSLDLRSYDRLFPLLPGGNPLTGSPPRARGAVLLGQWVARERRITPRVRGEQTS